MKNSKTIDQYISQFPDNKLHAILKKIRSEIKSAAPKASEVIKYGIPTFILNGKNLVHFGAFKNHIGFFPTPPAIVAFKKELTSYKLSKGTIQFPTDKPIPYTLIKRIVRYRVKNIN